MIAPRGESGGLTRNLYALPYAPEAAPRRFAPLRSGLPVGSRAQRTRAREGFSAVAVHTWACARRDTAALRVRPVATPASEPWAPPKKMRCWAAAPTRLSLVGIRVPGARGATPTGSTGGWSTSRSPSRGAQRWRARCRRATPPRTCSRTPRATAQARAVGGCWPPATPPSSSAPRPPSWRSSARSPPSLWASAPCASCATVSAPYSLSRPSCAC
jgi:hypothetical protein